MNKQWKPTSYFPKSMQPKRITRREKMKKLMTVIQDANEMRYVADCLELYNYSGRMNASRSKVVDKMYELYIKKNSGAESETN